MKVFELRSVMHHIRTVLLLLLLSPCLTLEQPHPQLKFLNQLLGSIRKSKAVNMIYMLHQHRAENCYIEHWKPRDTSIVRSTEMAIYQGRMPFNFYQAMALVCISQDADVSLLNNLVRNLHFRRPARIILWLQVRATKELLDEISRMAEQHVLTQMVVLEMINLEKATVKAFRLHPFPSPHFELLQNIFSFDGIFHFLSLLNFHGKEVIVLPRKDNILQYNVSYGPKKTFTINTPGDRHIIEFSLKMNLSLKMYQENRHGHYDLQLTPRLVSIKDVEECANPFTVVSLIVVVPCGQERSIQDVFKQLKFADWLLYILPVYATFVVVKWLIIYRITGQAHRLSFLNLRAFAAILGLPFTVRRGWSFSLRQLFLALSIFGFVFSNFFACKLSALLTKHSRYAQVKNLDQLRDSGLPVVIPKGVYDFLQRDMDANYLASVLPNTVILDMFERYRTILSLNDSFGYLVFKDFFTLVDVYQKALGRKVLCDARNLTLVSNLPKMFHLPEHSMFTWPLRGFVHRVYESGINKHWEINTIGMIRKVLNISIQSVVKQEAVPLSFEHLNWLWSLLIFGHGIATLVFLVELLLGAVKNWKRKQQARARFSEA